VFADVTLDKKGRLKRVDSNRNELSEGTECALADLSWFWRDGQGVEVYDRVEGVVGVLHGNPLTQRTQVVTDMERPSGRLDP
jgi:hypothetical protein